ncbi:hypothetical protein [Romboutsia ilealis]|uniref:hypothetical protein n=1 Tax=Romboutsia ilealis TaxID=1115758 RepID=UPI0026F3D3CD|nr:hypothetical protein [Romboutsia ilealis]
MKYEKYEIIDTKDYDLPQVGTMKALTDKQKYAVELLLQDVSLRKVAEQVGVSKSLIYKWTKMPQIQKILNGKNDAIVNNLYGKALMEIENQMDSDNVYARQWAVNKILEIKKSNTDININVGKKHTPQSLDELIAQIDEKY